MSSANSSSASESLYPYRRSEAVHMRLANSEVHPNDFLLTHLSPYIYIRPLSNGFSESSSLFLCCICGHRGNGISVLPISLILSFSEAMISAIPGLDFCLNTYYSFESSSLFKAISFYISIYVLAGCSCLVPFLSYTIPIICWQRESFRKKTNNEALCARTRLRRVHLLGKSPSHAPTHLLPMPWSNET